MSMYPNAAQAFCNIQKPNSEREALEGYNFSLAI